MLHVGRNREGRCAEMAPRRGGGGAPSWWWWWMDALCKCCAVQAAVMHTMLCHILWLSDTGEGDGTWEGGDEVKEIALTVWHLGFGIDVDIKSERKVD